MGAILYSFLAISSLLSTAFCFPFRSASQQLQPQQPTLDGLPSNSNVTLRYVALGVGNQNYTCNGTAWVQTNAGDGALATLYDATSWLAADTSAIKTLPANRLARFKAANDGQDLANLLPYLKPLGIHYFDESNRPTFNLTHANPPLVLSSRKIDSVAAPVADAIAWLYLLDADDGITDGLKAVYRVETAGGVAPSSCSSGQTGSQTSIPYAAEYWLYD
ncbi:hypothetical protein LTR36_007962 [Oleoguttula mirabilis]|uniref:Malate dehydrogenase n=1 Tax=Oleoguttula mirabilis TaxID=1507867 RepID=A0AAV9J8T5_9PEZI|nr:hypothetical protein LTR36_007962 [Oleoguttula mirabilis]